MKYNGFQLVSECIDGETTERPISTIDASTMKDATKISKESTPLVGKEADPKKVTSNKDKGIAAGDEAGKVEKELKKNKK